MEEDLEVELSEREVILVLIFKGFGLIEGVIIESFLEELIDVVEGGVDVG